MSPADPLTLFLAGDVMTGRGVDQIMRHPGDPTLHERWVGTATRYVELAEAANGSIPRSVAPEYVWGPALALLDAIDPNVRLVNLETAITDRGEPWPAKGVHYRMHPGNVACLTAARIDCVTLANNHALDWSQTGLDQTLDVLAGAGVAVAGAGRDVAGATAPARIETRRGAVGVVGVGTRSSGIPGGWQAGRDRPGLCVVDALSAATADQIGSVISATTPPGEVAVASIHWGGNWGHDIPRSHRAFARHLVAEGGVHVVHGHSSHHPLAVEVYRGRPIIYGCGDLITDYEGIRGHERYRPHLGLMWMVTLDPADGLLVGLRMVPTRLRRFRLELATADEAAWLCAELDRESRALGVRVEIGDDGHLMVRW